MDDAALIREAAELAGRGEPFVMATVVRRTAPSSARPGQKALILADGSLRGWLGGACIEPNVRREAVESLEDGRPRLVIFAPGGRAVRPEAGSHPDTVVYPMTCHSGGTVEIYVEPQLPAPTLALFGESPVNRALASMAGVAGYAVRVVGADEAGEAAEAVGSPEASGTVEDGGAPLFAVVATMGEWDEAAAEQALEAGAAYVGLVSSPRRAAEIRRVLRERGTEEASLDRLVSPAGLDLGAESPAEIAVSILAELIGLRRRGGEVAGPELEAAESRAAPPATAIDPVCGMTVEVERAHHAYEHAGTVYYFCCPRCRERFSGDPDRFVAA